VTFGCNLLCVLSYLEQTVEFDRRDDRNQPHQGYYLALSLQEGGGPLQGPSPSCASSQTFAATSASASSSG